MRNLHNTILFISGKLLRVFLKHFFYRPDVMSVIYPFDPCSIWLEVIMFFERSRFFRDNDMSALVLILRKEQYCMFVLYIRMFVGDRLNIIVTSVNTYPPKAVI